MLALAAEEAIASERRAFARSMAETEPAAGVMDIAGGCAVFTGRGFFSNRVFGLGLKDSLSIGQLEEIERFYAERGQSCEIELASMAAPSVVELLSARRYRLQRFRNIYGRTLERRPAMEDAGNIGVERVGEATRTVWSSILVDGFGYEEPSAVARTEAWNDGLLSTEGLTAFLGSLADGPAGAASVFVDGPVAVLGGAATLPPKRRRGVHSALIRARLQHAARAGCELAVVTADPGSTSARNSERAGFRLVCTHAVLVAEDRRG